MGPDQAVRVECDRECSVRLMDDANYAGYIDGQTFRYFGGLCRDGFAAVIKPPSAGNWNVVIDPTKVGEPLRHAVHIVSGLPGAW